MLAVAIAASVALVALAALAPLVANIRTPRNLRDWYSGRQAAATWAGVGVALIMVWGVYLALLLS